MRPSSKRRPCQTPLIAPLLMYTRGWLIQCGCPSASVVQVTTSSQPSRLTSTITTSRSLVAVRKPRSPLTSLSLAYCALRSTRIPPSFIKR